MTSQSAEPIVVATAGAMRDLGERLAALAVAGDFFILSGPLGAGKTTLAQGIGRGLGIATPIVSPTFVIARAHHEGRLPLLHVDAYRLSSVAEIDDLDLDASIEDSLTVVEWGHGLVEGLAADRLEVDIQRPPDDIDETRSVTITVTGDRWRGADLGYFDLKSPGRR